MPLSFVCQLNLAGAPFVPKLLADIRLLTLFADLSAAEFGLTNGSNWCLRAYSDTEDLVELEPPSAHLVGQAAEGEWKQVVDEPTFYDRDLEVPDGVDASEYASRLVNVPGTKVGGFPSCINGELLAFVEGEAAAPAYCIQISSEPRAGFSWGGGGRAFLLRGTARGAEDSWFLEEHPG